MIACIPPRPAVSSTRRSGGSGGSSGGSSKGVDRASGYSTLSFGDLLGREGVSVQ